MLIKMHFETEEQVIQQLDELLKKDPETLNRPVNLSKDTLLHYAAYHKKLKIVNFLLQKGANKGAENSFKLKPMEVVVPDEDGSDKEVVDQMVKILA